MSADGFGSVLMVSGLGLRASLVSASVVAASGAFLTQLLLPRRHGQLQHVAPMNGGLATASYRALHS